MEAGLARFSQVVSSSSLARTLTCASVLGFGLARFTRTPFNPAGSAVRRPAAPSTALDNMVSPWVD